PDAGCLRAVETFFMANELTESTRTRHVAAEAPDGAQRWPRSSDPALRRQLLIVAALIAVSVALRALSWDPIADGGRSRYLKSVAIAGVSAAAVWGLVWLQAGARSWLPTICAALLLVAGDAIHYVRLANPITRGAAIMAVSGSFVDEAAVRQQWDIETGNGGRVRFEDGAIILESPPGGVAHIGAKLGKLPDVGFNWWLPIGLADRERVEELTWRARITRTGGYYVVAELRSILVQLVPYGIHITYPDERNALRGHEVQHSAGSDGQMHEWRLVRDARDVSLHLDGKTVWSAPQRGELNQLKLGETKTDREHGGTMRIELASYVTSLDRR
ncbi:MAG TPA: hypothetical protein VNM48_06935, partial [Chloroflexota bacterium]|nr:hypothetical protein [Chloroflexota bacterium]